MADVSVDATISTATARGLRSVVFTTDQIGYVFYLDGSGVFSYAKTTDGGAVWGAAVAVDGAAATTTVAVDIWFDKWTPGDTGTLIHCWWFDVTNDMVRWRTLNTSGDTLGTVRTVFTGASAVAGRGAFVSGTKTRSGYLYCAYDIDAGAERGLHRSTDSGTTWSTNLATTFVEATLDTCKLFPASGTGDDNDCWALYYDASALELTLKLWDSSAVAQVESAAFGVAHGDGATDLTGQFGYSGSVRHSDGHLIVAALSGRDTPSSVHQVFDITSTSTITTKTAIADSTDDHYYPQVFIDQTSNAIYVAYNGKRDGSDVLDTTTKVYYTRSTDGGTTWSAGDAAYMEGAAGVVLQVWAPLSGARFYAVWRVGTTLLGNTVNSVLNALFIGGATLASTAQFGYTETLVVEQDGVQGNSENAPGRATTGQTISGHAGLVTSVSLKLRRSGTPTDAMYLEIRESSRDGTLRATSSQVSAAGLSTTAAWFNFVVPPFTITAGTTYWIESYLTRTASDGTNYWLVNVNTAGTYAGGDRYSGTTVSSGDMAFRLYTGTSHTVALAGGVADQAVTGATVAVGSAVTAPTVTPGAVTVTAATLTSGVQVRVPTVTTGAVTVTGATVTSGLQVRAPTITAGAVTVTGATLTSGAVVRVPTVTTGAVTLSGATRATSLQLFAPSVTTGAVTVQGATVLAGAVLRAPRVGDLPVGVVTDQPFMWLV